MMNYRKAKLIKLIFSILVVVVISVVLGLVAIKNYLNQMGINNFSLIYTAETILNTSSAELNSIYSIKPTDSSNEKSSSLPMVISSAVPSSNIVQSNPNSTPKIIYYKGYEFKDISSIWGNPSTLQDHFDRHGKDFSVNNSQEYAFEANIFFRTKNNYQVKTDSTGVIRVYDPQKNIFGSYNPNGTTKTFFKPSDGQDYFDRQPGS